MSISTSYSNNNNGYNSSKRNDTSNNGVNTLKRISSSTTSINVLSTTNSMKSISCIKVPCWTLLLLLFVINCIQIWVMYNMMTIHPILLDTSTSNSTVMTEFEVLSTESTASTSYIQTKETSNGTLNVNGTVNNNVTVNGTVNGTVLENKITTTVTNNVIDESRDGNDNDKNENVNITTTIMETETTNVKVNDTDNDTVTINTDSYHNKHNSVNIVKVDDNNNSTTSTTNIEKNDNASNGSNESNENSDTNNESILCGGCFFANIIQSTTNENENENENIKRNHKDSKNDQNNRMITCGQHIRQSVYQSLFSNNSSSTTKNETEQHVKEQLEQEEKNEHFFRQIIHTMQMNNKTQYKKLVQKAAYDVSIRYPTECYYCNPATCSSESDDSSTTGSTTTAGSTTIYHSYDTAAPIIRNSWTYYLRSIPYKNRYPLYGVTNMEEFILNETKLEVDYYFEFNPSIIAIPEHERIQHKFIHPITLQSVHPTYLISFRVSQNFLCVYYNWGKFARSGPIELLGLAYVDDNFILLAEGLYEMPEEDVRLFTLPSRYIENQYQIYLTYCKLQSHGDKSYRRAMQRELFLIPPSNDLKIHTITREPIYVVSNNGDNSTIINKMPPIYLKNEPNCLTITESFIDAKNIVYFEDNNLNSTSLSSIVLDDGTNFSTSHITTPIIVAENWPPQQDRTHKVSFIELKKPVWCPASYTYHETDGELVSTNDDYYSKSDNNRIIQPSFYTIEEQLYSENLISHVAPWNDDRGNACCIEMINPITNEKVLVGISHAKLHSEDTVAQNMMPEQYRRPFVNANNAYLSRFYAFEPIQPYKTVALSGHFCWPIISLTNTSTATTVNEYSNSGDKLYFIKSESKANTTTEDEKLFCPVIHFVMSFLYKVNSNQSSVIISFGVNDCTPRFIEVLTSDIQQLLFYGIKSSSSPK